MRALRLLAMALVWIVASVSSGRASPAPPTLTVDKNFGKVAGWSIGYSNSLGGCLAAASYRDGTTIWFGFGATRGAYIAFTNEKWRSIEVGGQYDIVLSTRREKWNGTFTGFARDDVHGLFQSSLKDKFVLDLSESGAVDLRFEGRPLTHLSLVGSTDAFEAVVGCQKREGPADGREASAGREEPHKLGAGMVSTGTGFYVSEQGHVLTNNHVVEACTEYQVRRPGYASTAAHLVATDATNDLAVLRTDMSQKFVPALSIRARVGESIFVYGFPQTDTLSSSGNFTVGNVTASAGMKDDTRSIQISAPVHMGNSGGPVLDRFGNVVGIIQSKASAAAFGASHDVPQNVNFAIKSAIALNFLEAHGIDASISVRKSDPMEAEGVAEISRSFVVQVVCR